MRQAERAIFDLRRGLPILVRDNGSTTLIQAVEGLDDKALAELQALGASQPRLVLSSHRMAALGFGDTEQPAAVSLSPLPDSKGLHELASKRDARLPEGAHHAPAGKADRAAVRLLSHALLVPAAIACDVAAAQAAQVEAEVANGNLLVVDADTALQLGVGGPAALNRISEARVPLAEAEQSRFVLFREADGVHEHVAVVIGDPASWPEDVPVRLHSSCLTGDLFGSLRCDCGEQLRRGVAAINAQGGGVLLYLSQEGRGIGLANKLRAYTRQDAGLDTIDADRYLGFRGDERRFAVAARMLRELGIGRVRLLTNNPTKISALVDAGIEVTERLAIGGAVTAYNARYLATKRDRAGHLIEMPASSVHPAA